MTTAPGVTVTTSGTVSLGDELPIPTPGTHGGLAGYPTGPGHRHTPAGLRSSPGGSQLTHPERSPTQAPRQQHFP